MCPASKGAALMTAGHDEIRRSGPNQKCAFLNALHATGLPDPRFDRIAITSLFTLARLKFRGPGPAAPAGAGGARLIHLQVAAGTGRFLR